jgi:hypothetical protein
VAHRVLVVAVVVGLAVAGCGSGDEARHATPTTAAPPAATGAPAATTVPPDSPRAAPRWETVSTFSGTGPSRTPEFDVLAEAIQWRVRWTCETGRLRIVTVPPPRLAGPLVDEGCPGGADAYSIRTGRSHLEIEAAGPWKAIVDQQLEIPLEEPPFPEMATAPVVARGTFHAVEKEGKGSARVYELDDGRRVVRFEGFEVSTNTDLFVWLSEAVAPRTTVDAQAAPKVSIGNLKSTLGDQNYEVPADLPSDRIRSIVIWCEPVSVAYIAAPLER